MALAEPHPYTPARDPQLTEFQNSNDPLVNRGVRATWWYTSGGIVFFQVMLVWLWAVMLGELVAGPAVWVMLGGGALWTIISVAILGQYFRRSSTGDESGRTVAVVAVIAASAYGIAVGGSLGLWLLLVLPVAQTTALLIREPSLRSKYAWCATAVLGCLAFVDAPVQGRLAEVGSDTPWVVVGFYTCCIPLMSVFSLWWWDVVVRLDTARAAEARLADTQERLLVATDVHDLQGHHLQVIALQLELAERLLDRSPAAAAEHIRAARSSVDAARQGTREIAAPFRGIPVPDELENAADLLRAAGAEVRLTMGSGAHEAPADVLGPIIRETTTNVLKHGGGVWVHLTLERTASGWQLSVANDVSPESRSGVHPAHGADAGTGIAGMNRRVADLGGSVQVCQGVDQFAVKVVVA